MIHGTLQAQVIAAGALAIPTAFPDLYELSGENREVLKSLWTTFRPHKTHDSKTTTRTVAGQDAALPAERAAPHKTSNSQRCNSSAKKD